MRDCGEQQCERAYLLRGPNRAREMHCDLAMSEFQSTPKIPDSEVTPPALYFNRRKLMRAGALAASVAGTGWIYRRLNTMSLTATDAPKLPTLVASPSTVASATREGVGEALTSLMAVTHYNNFYEFTTDKDRVAERAAGFSTTGWKVEVELPRFGGQI